MRLFALAAAALVAAGCMARGTSSGSDSAGSTVLEISVSRGGESPTKVWTLRCPAGGTLPNAARACKRLLALERPFAPTPKQAACTLIYGGPQVADVRGTFKGRRVKARFTRKNGCEIERWNRVRFLFPNA
jgi:hypothetical protein